MDINADFSKRALVHSEDLDWVPSPMAGVDRRMLDRIGDEVARATSIVRYAAGSAFSAHTHTGGEEFIVLEGTFQDEHGDYPAGTYVRNPPTTHHTPSSRTGCVIFVKLWQFDMQDRTQFRKDMTADLPPPINGVAASVLHQDARETVTLFQIEPETNLDLQDAGGIEVLVLDGSLQTGADTLVKGSWLRLPDGAHLTARTSADRATIWVKTGHLPYAKAPSASA